MILSYDNDKIILEVFFLYKLPVVLSLRLSTFNKSDSVTRKTQSVFLPNKTYTKPKMTKKLLFLILLSFLPFVGKAQENGADTSKPAEVPTYYEKAFTSIKAMLEGKQPMSFKKAVLIAENAYFENTLDTLQIEMEIRWYAILCKLYQQANPIIGYNFKDHDEVSLRGAVFKVLTDTVSAVIQQEKIYHLPFTYDFDDFFGDVSWAQTFVSKLLRTKKGNCHSLPYLYKILCEELGLSAHLALAPNHIYTKMKFKMRQKLTQRYGEARRNTEFFV
jgi:hypothetical protein